MSKPDSLEFQAMFLRSVMTGKHTHPVISVAYTINGMNGRTAESLALPPEAVEVILRVALAHTESDDVAAKRKKAKALREEALAKQKQADALWPGG